MTRKEAENKLINGSTIRVVFGIKKTYKYLDDISISEKQYQLLIDKYKDKLNFKMKTEGLTTHYYSINKA